MIRYINKEVTKPLIKFTASAWLKIQTMAQYTTTQECGLEGTVVKEGDVYTITDVFVYPQVITAATVTTDDLAYAQWLMTLSDEQINTKRFQVHSHVNMAVSPSGVDTNAYDKYIKLADDFMIFMIVNRKHEFNIWLYDIEANLIYEKEDLDTTIVIDGQTEEDWYKQQASTCIKTITAPSYTNKINVNNIKADTYTPADRVAYRKRAEERINNLIWRD